MRKHFAPLLFVFFAMPVVSATADDFEQIFGKIDPDGIKVCSAVVGGDWRNDLIVPQTWELEECAAWAAQIGGAHNRACLHTQRVDYEPTGGWNTCGWH